MEQRVARTTSEFVPRAQYYPLSDLVSDFFQTYPVFSHYRERGGWHEESVVRNSSFVSNQLCGLRESGRLLEDCK
jgi:hypothetical protein